MINQSDILNKMGDLETQHPIQCAGADLNIGKMYKRWDKLKEFIIKPPNKKLQMDVCECETDIQDINKWNFCPMCGGEI